MTLTPAEVEHSLPDRPDLPKVGNREKEWHYLQNNFKYEQMKRDRTYTDQRPR